MFNRQSISNVLPEIICLIVAGAVAVGPLMVNMSTLPFGWELPKVFFWQLVSLIIILLGFAAWLISKQRKFSRYNIVVVALGAAIMSISSFINFYPREVSSIHNALSNFLMRVFQPTPELHSALLLNISFWGNQFRDQGLLTFVLIVVAMYVVWKSLSKFRSQMIFAAFVISACIQSVIGIVQFFRVFAIYPDKAVAGNWVFGMFGQANFFAGHLLVGLIFACYFLRSRKQIRILAALAVGVILTAIVASFSLWAYVIAFGIVAVAISYDNLPKAKFSKVMKLGLLVALLLAVPVGIVFLHFFPDYDFRIQIWREIINVNLNTIRETPLAGLMKVLFGWGFDTLGDVFTSFSKFPTAIVDRAHNVFLDVFMSVGLVGLSAFVGLLWNLFAKLTRKLKSREATFACLALGFWLARSIIHESSIINLVDFAVILMIAAYYAFVSGKDTKTT